LGKGGKKNGLLFLLCDKEKGRAGIVFRECNREELKKKRGGEPSSIAKENGKSERKGKRRRYNALYCDRYWEGKGGKIRRRASG